MSEYDEIGEQLDAYIARLGARYGYSPDSDTPDSYRAFSVGVMRSMIFSMALHDREHFNSTYGEPVKS